MIHFVLNQKGPYSIEAIPLTLPFYHSLHQLRCKTFDYEKRISIIDTINVCVDRNSNEVIDCPGHFDSNCLETVYYPTHLLEKKISEEMTYRDMNYYR